MTWFYLSLIAPAVWACVNIVDKIVVSKYINKAIVYLIFTSLAAIVPIILLPIKYNFEPLSMKFLALSILTGSIYILYTWFFFRSLQLSDAPVVANLLLLVPILSLFLGTLLFHERFYLSTYIGVGFVISGVLGTSLEKKQAPTRDRTTSIRDKLILTPAFTLMLISAFITSVDYALEKYILMHTTQLTLFYWNRVGVLIAGLIVLVVSKSLRHDFISVLRSARRIVVPISFLNEILDMTAAFLLISAYYLGPLSLVTTVISIQPLFVLVFVGFVNRIRPNIIPERGGRNVFMIRSAAIAIALIGIYLISLAR